MPHTSGPLGRLSSRRLPPRILPYVALRPYEIQRGLHIDVAGTRARASFAFLPGVHVGVPVVWLLHSTSSTSSHASPFCSMSCSPRLNVLVFIVLMVPCVAIRAIDRSIGCPGPFVCDSCVFVAPRAALLLSSRSIACSGAVAYIM